MASFSLRFKALLAEFLNAADLANICMDSAEASAMYASAADRVAKESRISCFSGESAVLWDFI